ncbi:hypothetical protein QBC40DRAFT_293050 [Triangularia verruculosa]|uniref:Uncharacterized protein n=1 Tax=Triangularia verruculosa TaxID=2587418 RepID=A0AAN6XTL4_9PEZI|nr:hypothetical protein QBC40DRAFT_293050 [Triangularia verruculosa]
MVQHFGVIPVTQMGGIFPAGFHLAQKWGWLRAQHLLLKMDVRKLPIHGLNENHRDILTRAISRLLATDIAKITFAQILDGLPTAEVGDDCSDGELPDGHPLREKHRDLCPGVLDKLSEFRDSFQPESLEIDTGLLHSYQTSSPGSRVFRTRLVELVAIVLHEAAVMLFNLDTSLHKHDGITEWAPPKDDDLYWRYFPNGPFPTLFTHPWYVDYDQYPNSVADMVGYWAEARIFGGVVLFDRRSPNDTADADRHAIYFHPNRALVTYRICRLLEDQKHALLEFLTADTPGENPLPILPTEENTYRIDPEEPLTSTGIYRNIWERKDLPIDGPDGRNRASQDFLNFPTRTDQVAAQRRLRRRRQREAELQASYDRRETEERLDALD